MRLLVISTGAYENTCGACDQIKGSGIGGWRCSLFSRNIGPSGPQETQLRLPICKQCDLINTPSEEALLSMWKEYLIKQVMES
jgi:hypothetical protein